MRILIAPFAQKLKNGKVNPKNYPFWKELIAKLVNDNHNIVQIGVEGEEQFVAEFWKSLSLDEILKLVDNCDLWVSIDSFLSHLVQDYNKKKGIVIFGKSDPEIFGYPNNLNLLKDKKFLRKYQFLTWEEETFDSGVFIDVDTLYGIIKKWKKSS